jgi:hypothetical protein
MSVGIIVGLVLSSSLYGIGGFTLPFWAGATMSMLLIPLTQIYMPTDEEI